MVLFTTRTLIPLQVSMSTHNQGPGFQKDACWGVMMLTVGSLTSCRVILWFYSMHTFISGTFFLKFVVVLSYKCIMRIRILDFSKNAIPSHWRILNSFRLHEFIACCCWLYWGYHYVELSPQLFSSLSKGGKLHSLRIVWLNFLMDLK